VPAGGSVTGGNSSNYVDGTMQKGFAPGSGQSFTFPIGKGAAYRPIDLTGLNVSTPGTVTTTNSSTDHPQAG